MTRQEVDDYLVIIDKNLEWPEPMKSYMMTSLREWGYADDGKEFMMLNMMRYHDELLDYPGSINGFKGTPQWVVPDLRLITGMVLLILFFTVGWIRAELRNRR